MLSSARWRRSVARASRACARRRSCRCRSRGGRALLPGPLAGPARAAHDQDFGASIHSSVWSARWVLVGIAERSAPRRRTFCRPAGPRRGAWSRIVACSRPLTSSERSTRRTSACSHRCAAAGRAPRARLCGCRQPHAAQQLLELVGQRGRGGRLDRHRRPPIRGRSSDPVVRSVAASPRGPQIASLRVGFSRASVIRGVHRPNPSHERVERCSEDSSEALSGSGTTTACCCWWARIACRSPSANRPA